MSHPEQCMSSSRLVRPAAGAAAGASDTSTAASPAIEAPVDDHAPADPGAEGEHDHVTRALRGAGPELGEGRHVGVVVHVDGQAEPLTHEVAERHALQREMGAEHRRAGIALHE